MKTFSMALIAAATASGAYAACNARYCGRFTEWEDGLSAVGPSYEWHFENQYASDGQRTRQFRFLGNVAGDGDITDQGINGPVLLISPVSVYCIDWFDNTQDSGNLIHSIPHQLFEAGYDVWISCRRGQPPSRQRRDLINNDGTNLDPVTEAEQYWDHNLTTIGTTDVQAYIAEILRSRRRAGDDCKKVQIITHDSGVAEALINLASYPTSADLWIGHQINLSPCPIGPPQNPNDLRRRRQLEEKEMDLSNRQLGAEFLDVALDGEERLGRTLKRRKSRGSINALVSHRGSSKSSRKNKLPDGFIGRIADEVSPSKSPEWDKYVQKHSTHEHFWQDVGEACEENEGGDPLKDCFDFCTWYPTLCDEFNARFPQYARPAEIEFIYSLFNASYAAGIYSWYGDNFAADVETICMDLSVSADACTYLRGMVGSGLMETAVQVLEHQFQNAWLQEFADFNPTFYTDGWRDGAVVNAFDLSVINVPLTNIYTKENDICSQDRVIDLFDSLGATQRYRQVFTDPSLTPENISGSNANSVFMTALFDALEAGKLQDAGPANGRCRGFNTWVF